MPRVVLFVLVAGLCLGAGLWLGCSQGTSTDPVDGAARIAPTPPAYPLRASANGRYLVDRNGTPLLLHGDAAWSALVNLTREQMDVYLDDRRAKGFNALYVNLIEAAFSNQVPPRRTVYGDEPFTGTLDGYYLDLTTPNEAYWRHVDTFLDKAEARGFVVIAFPAYAGWQQGHDGWGITLDLNGPEHMRTYGAFLGRRYASQPNLIWAAGGDWGPTGPYDLVADYQALADGIRAHDSVHLWTGHGGQQSGADVYGYLDIDLNTTYRYPPEGVPEAVRADYQRRPVQPFVFFEGWYENEHGVSLWGLRYQAYTSLLGGASGSFYGHSPIWRFGPGWEAGLDAPGARAMVHVGDLFRSRPFHRLVPDYDHTLVPENVGSLTAGTYVAAARADDGSTALVYVPDQRTVTVNLDGFGGAEVRAWCYDPTTGAATDLGTRSGQGRQRFTPCAAPDWVLVLDEAARGWLAPGTRAYR